MKLPILFIFLSLLKPILLTSLPRAFVKGSAAFMLFMAMTSGVVAKTDSTVNKADGFIVTNVNIIDVENKRVLASRDIYVRDGQIRKIVSSGLNDVSDIDLLMEEGERYTHRINGNGGFITPGLIDMHVHMYEPAAYLMTLSHGVTHVRILNGVPKHLEWRDKIASGEMVGSTSTVSSPIISGYKNAYLHHGVTTEEEAKKAVKMFKQQGYDLIKAYGNLNQEALRGVLKQANLSNISVAKHGPHGSGDMAIGELSGIQSFEHMEDIYQGPLNYQFELDLLPQIMSELKETKVPLTPTLNIFHQLTQLSAEKEDFLNKTFRHYTSDIIALETKNNQLERWLEASPAMIEHNKKTMAFLSLLTQHFYDAGIPLLVGSDSGVLLSPHGIATHNEMALLEEAGMSKYDVLAAATINAAKALQMQNKIGKIDEHYTADFIYTKNNPLLDLSVLKNPDAVTKRGHWYSSAELTKMRDDAIEGRSFWGELLTLMEAL